MDSDLFNQVSYQRPLAERMRPKTIDDVIGQTKLIGTNGPLRKMFDNKIARSIIFWGPPGTGKTTLARLLAQGANLPYFSLSAIQAGVKEVRDVIEKAKRNGRALLFLDEIHRFNKSQQDSLLAAIEDGTLVLIGATTENPSFEVNAALLSRCQVFHLESLTESELEKMVNNALLKDEILSKKNITINATEALIRLSGGDGRRLYNLLEASIALNNHQNLTIDDELVMQAAQQQTPLYDKKGEMHYDIISAFIKSMRGSDPNAALYYLARMLNAGEDIEFIARRMLILASEDIGNANPNALLLAEACLSAVKQLGMPEARIPLGQTVIYLASSPKSNASYSAIDQAIEVAKQTAHLQVPLHLRNAPTKLMKSEDYGKGYKYAHDFDGNFVKQDFLPEQLKGKSFYKPGNNQREDEIKKRLLSLWGNEYNF